jgi:large subunit ribosomal protein L6
MSRLGKIPVTVPKGVDVKIDGRTVTVSGKQGTLSYEHRPEVEVAFDEGERKVVVSMPEDQQKTKSKMAHWGTTRSLIANMVEGVANGYEKSLEVVGVGYTATLAGNTLQLKVGYANTIERPVPEGVDVKVEKQTIKVSGADKQAVGQFAASVRAVRKPEPYNGKGIMYTGERVRRKAGKAFGS